MGFLSSIFSNENRTRTDMEKKLFVLADEKRGWTRGAAKSEKQILKDVFDIIEEVPETKKLLDDVAKQGYKFFFQRDTGKAEGACDGTHKYIMLNPTIMNNTAEIAIAAVHEMTHAMQCKNLGDLTKNASSLNMADQIKVARAKEAGAVLQESFFAHRILDKHPEAKAYVESSPMAMAYINEMNKSGDKGKAAEKCFKEWYDYEKYQRPYEDQHIDYMVFDLEHSSKKALHLQDSISSEEIIDKCIYSEDHKKAVSPEFLNSPEANRLTAAGRRRLDIISENCEKYFGVKDTSYMQMVSYRTGKTHEETKSLSKAFTRTDMEESLVVWKNKDGEIRGAEDSERQILKDVFDIIEKVPETKKLLDDVAKEGYEFHFLGYKGGKNAMASCSISNKHIMLNPRKCNSVAEIASVCVHEMTHAMQFKELGAIANDVSGLNLADRIRLNRAQEAGAYVQQAAFSYQIQKEHPEIKKFIKEWPMLETYASEMEKSGDKGKAAEKCFKEWYDYEPYQRFYENEHIDNILFNLDHSSKKEPHPQASITSEEIIGKCIYSEEYRKAIPSEFLQSPEANRLSDNGKKRLDTVSKKCEKYFGVKDTSYMQMVSYKTGKTYEGKDPAQATVEKPKESMMVMLSKTEQAKLSEKPSLMATLTATQKAADAVKAGVVKTAQNSR